MPQQKGTGKKTGSMPDHIPSLDAEDEYIPWDCDGQDEDLGNYDYGETGLGDDE